MGVQSNAAVRTSTSSCLEIMTRYRAGADVYMCVCACVCVYVCVCVCVCKWNYLCKLLFVNLCSLLGRELREHKAAIVPAVNCIISSEGYSTSRNRTLKEWGEQRQKHKKVRRPSQYSTAKRGAMSQRDTHTHTHKVVHRGRDNAQLRASRLRYFEVNSSSWFRMSEVPTCCTHHRRCKLGDGKAHD